MLEDRELIRIEVAPHGSLERGKALVEEYGGPCSPGSVFL